MQKRTKKKKKKRKKISFKLFSFLFILNLKMMIVVEPRCRFKPGTANTKFRQHPYRCHCGKRDLHLASTKMALKIFMGNLLELVFCSSVTILCFHSVALHAGCPLLVLPPRSFKSEAGGRGCPRGGSGEGAGGGSPSPCPLHILPSAWPGTPRPLPGGEGGSTAALGGGPRPPPPPAPARRRL